MYQSLFLCLLSDASKTRSIATNKRIPEINVNQKFVNASKLLMIMRENPIIKSTRCGKLFNLLVISSPSPFYRFIKWFITRILTKAPIPFMIIEQLNHS